MYLYIFIFTAIATSFTPSERLAAVQLAKETLDHTDAAMHNEELRLGADSVLAKHLAFVLHENQQHHQAVAAQNVEEEEPEAPRRPPATMLLHSKPLPSETTKSAANSCSSKDDATIPDSTIANTRSMIRTELSLTCDALESVFRASSTVVGASFRRLGSLLLQLLVSLLNDEIIQRRRCGGNCNDVVPMESLSSTEKTHPPLALPDPQSAPDIEVTKTSLEGANPVAGSTSDKLVVEGNHFDASSSDEGDAILKHATKMLGHFARVGETTQPMAHYPGLLSSLIALVELRSYQGAPWEARLPALWTLANLACNEENMRLMACYPGLIQALVNVANRQLHSSDSLETTMEVLRSRALASRAIFNLSWSPENKVLLAEQVNVVDFLADLIILRSAPKSLQKSSTVHEILSSTRCHAAGALRNLAAAPRRIKLHMCHHRKGHLLNVLTDAAINDIDKRVKFRAFATIHNLAIHDTAQTLASHPALVMALKDVLLSTEDASELVQDSTDGTLKEHASATLLVLERSIKPSMDSYVNILDLLDAIHPTDDSVGGTAHLDSSCDFANQIAAG